MTNKPQYVYVASSWRCAMQPAVVAVLKAAEIDCYDFKDSEGFHWQDVMPKWKSLNAEAGVPAVEYLEAIEHPVAEKGFRRDFEAMERADAFVLVLPCGRSAHLELGWAVGQGKRTAVLLDGDEVIPELMYKMVDHISPSIHDLLGWLGVED